MQEQVKQWLQEWNLAPWTWNLIIVAAATLLGLFIRLLLLLFAQEKAKEENSRFSFFRSLIRHLGTPFTFFLPLFLFNLLLPIMRIKQIMIAQVDKGVEILLMISFAWILLSSIKVVQDYVYYKFDYNRKSDNLRERKIRTQLQFIRRFISGLIVLLTIAAVLLSFSTMRKIGAGLLTGVGVGGIIIGFAAQRSLANLLAGFQIAFTQPIRIDDAVIVEGEWGTIEEITLTYVVVRIWDQRRLILPIHYFIEKPFQNWTRTTAELLATVFIHADYSLPIEPIRNELTRLLKENKWWDGRASAVQVTNATDKSIELRIMMSARSAGDAWDLRCYIREELIKFIRDHYPQCLPKTRAELDNTTK
jgi:small-conductance mechanosensitive channel